VFSKEVITTVCQLPYTLEELEQEWRDNAGQQEEDAISTHKLADTYRGFSPTGSAAQMETICAKTHLTKQEAALYLAISIRKISMLVCEGRIPLIKIGSKAIFRRSDLDYFVRSSYAKR